MHLWKDVKHNAANVFQTMWWAHNYILQKDLVIVSLCGLYKTFFNFLKILIVFALFSTIWIYCFECCYTIIVIVCKKYTTKHRLKWINSIINNTFLGFSLTHYIYILIPKTQMEKWNYTGIADKTKKVNWMKIMRTIILKHCMWFMSFR